LAIVSLGLRCNQSFSEHLLPNSFYQILSSGSTAEAHYFGIASAVQEFGGQLGRLPEFRVAV